MKPYAFLFLALFVAINLFSIDISGVQSGIWSSADNPYNLVGDVTVPAGSDSLSSPE